MAEIKCFSLFCFSCTEHVFISNMYDRKWSDGVTFGQWMCTVFKHNYIQIGSFISLVWTSDPIVPSLTAGALDRKAGLYMVNTLIPSSASPAHVHSRPECYLTWKKKNMCSSAKERGGFLGRTGTSVWSVLPPIKGNLVTLLLSSVSDRRWLFSRAVRGPEVPSISAESCSIRGRREDGGTRQ